MMPIYMVCGVPGSGKTWVCNQLTDRFLHLPHDEFIDHDYSKALLKAAEGSDRPILADCPFAERALREKLERQGARVLTYFIVEEPEIIRARYEAREKKECPRNVLTRAISIKARAEDWRAPHGTALQILRVLKELPL